MTSKQAPVGNNKIKIMVYWYMYMHLLSRFALKLNKDYITNGGRLWCWGFYGRLPVSCQISHDQLLRVAVGSW